MSSESVFSKYIDDLENEPPKVDPAAELLRWLTAKWTKPTVSAREICQFGPRATKDLKSVLGLTEILMQRGILIPIPTPNRQNIRQWCIVREPTK
jgi:hypothetical protein